MDFAYGKTKRFGNYGVTLYRELLPQDGGDPRWVSYLRVNVASGDWDMRLYEFSPMYQYIRLAVNDGDGKVVEMILANIQNVMCYPDINYIVAQSMLAIVAGNPLLLKEGYDDGKTTHAGFMESLKAMAGRWVADYEKELSAIRDASDTDNPDMDAAADAAIDELES